jgi:hypothetical protein
MCSVCPETLSFRDKCHSQKQQHASQQCYLSRRYINRVVSCARDTQRTAELSCDRMIMEYTHTTCSQPSVPVTVELVLPHRNTCYVILVDVIRTLTCFADWSNVSVRQEV